MSKRKTPNIRLEASPSSNHADLYLFGVIGSWWDDNTAESVLSELQAHDNLSTIDVYISTVGGTFLDGLPIYNLLKNHKATVTTKVIGYSLSMGSVIMLAGDKIEAAQNSLVMIHNAQGVAWGSAAEMRQSADKLDKHEQAIMPRYRERMNLATDDVQALLDAETWYTADEALAAGLIDEIIDPVDLDDTDQSQPENSWKFAAENFRNPPEHFQHRVQNALANKPHWLEKILNTAVGKPEPVIRPELSESRENEEEPVTPEQIQAIADKVTEEATGMKPAEFKSLMQKVADLQQEVPEMVAKADHDAIVAELDQAKTDLAEANAKIAELSEEIPPSDEGVENAGFSEDEGWSKDY